MKQLLFTSALAMLLFSCSKQETQTSVVNSLGSSISDYSKLTVGNYWIYEILNVDTLGNATPEGTDSCYVKSDSIFNGKTYAVVVNTNPSGIYRGLERDSSLFLVDQNGTIIFAYGDFNTAIYKDSVPDTGSSMYSVSSVPSVVTVPMGTYTCFDYKGTFITAKDYPWGHVRYSNSYYAVNIGMIESIYFYYDAAGTIQYKLIRSHVL